MVRKDPSMLEGFTEEDVAEMVEETLANRTVKMRGTRVNNLVASADARRTLERLMVEVRVSFFLGGTWVLTRQLRSPRWRSAQG
jgi:hypothetical protein